MAKIKAEKKKKLNYQKESHKLQKLINIYMRKENTNTKKY